MLYCSTASPQTVMYVIKSANMGVVISHHALHPQSQWPTFLKNIVRAIYAEWKHMALGFCLESHSQHVKCEAKNNIKLTTMIPQAMVKSQRLLCFPVPVLLHGLLLT